MTRKKNQPLAEDSTALQATGEQIDKMLTPTLTQVKREIKKAKITSANCLSIDYEESITIIDGLKRNDINRSLKNEGHNIVHEDLLIAFHKLNLHLALIAEMIDLEDEPVGEFNTTGFTIGGSGESEGVVLIGQHTLSTEKVLNLVTPFTKWTDPYRMVNELSLVIEECKHEVLQYLDGKMAPPAQAEMEFDQEEKEPEQVEG